jgi:hypothetical protein
VSYYLPTGQEPEGPVDLVERRELREDERLELERERLEVDRRRAKAQERAAFWEALQAIATIGIPLAAFFGLKEYFAQERKKTIHV